MLSFLLAVASFSFGRTDGVAFYLALTLGSSFVVGILMRRDVRRRRAEEALLPPAQRPARRVPRRAISFPILESSLTFAAWYAAAVVIDLIVTGAVNVFTLVAIAPFASFMLTTLTIAGRHMAFRLTAEEMDDDTGDSRSGRGGVMSAAGDAISARREEPRERR